MVVHVSGSTAVISGATSGLGEATAGHLHKLGANVILLGRKVERGEVIAQSLGDRAKFVRANVAATQDLQAAMDCAVSTFGAVHILVNCAGIGINVRTLSKTGPHDIDLFKKVIAVDLVGTFDADRLAAEKMARNEPNDWGERGVIVNTASISAFEGTIGQAAYAASKAGIVGMTLVLARDLASFGIRACTISPGAFDTTMMAPLPEAVREGLVKATQFPQRFGRPEEYAMLVQQIVENPMLNGETIRLDGAFRFPFP